MPLRPKPQRGNPAYSSETVYRQQMNEWVADAMQDAADRIEKALAMSVCPPVTKTFYCVRCSRQTTHEVVLGGMGVVCSVCSTVSPLSAEART